MSNNQNENQAFVPVTGGGSASNAAPLLGTDSKLESDHGQSSGSFRLPSRSIPKIHKSARNNSQYSTTMAGDIQSCGNTTGISSSSVHSSQHHNATSSVIENFQHQNSSSSVAVTMPPSRSINNASSTGAAEGLLDPLCKSPKQEFRARRARNYLSSRYLSVRLRIFGLLFVIQSLIAIFLYFYYDHQYTSAINKFSETQCTVTAREVETIDFHELCPSTMNYRFHFDVRVVADTIADDDIFHAVSKHDNTPLKQAQLLDSARTSVSDTGAAGSVAACSGTSLTCYTGETGTGSECNRCVANSIHQCHKHVSLNENDYPQISVGAVVPCWVYTTSSESRVFLDDPSDIADYPKLEKYWIVVAVVFSVMCILASLYLLFERCKRSKSKR